MSKQEVPKVPNLDQLTETYEIIGELGGRDDARALMARRRTDGLDVLIVIGQTPNGDQGNALSHLAADVNLLSSISHRNFLRIVEGRWVGTDAFAIVSERTKAPTLHELLSRRDEEFAFPRIAAILREANGVLEWARDRKVVHRAITPETLFIEPGSDRVCVSFAINALPAGGMPGADADARTIASLARAMFTRSPAAPERAERPLAELRPGLPTRLVEDTEALLQPARDATAQDITGYISRIAMAEALKNGEVHLEEVRSAIEAQQRVHKEQLEKERREHEQLIANERKEHERHVTDQAKKFANEREEFERELAKERKALDRERDALAKERAAHAKDYEALGRERAAHARDSEALALERVAHANDHAALLQERGKHKRLEKEEREVVAAEALALQAQAQVHAQNAELRTAERQRMEARPAPVFVPTEPPKPRVSALERVKPAAPSRWRQKVASVHWDSRWNVPAAVVGLVLLIAVTALAIGGSGNRKSAMQLAQASPTRIVDSAGGAVTSYQSIVPLPQVTTDTAALAAIASDWTPPPRRRPKPIAPPPSPTQFDLRNRDSTRVDSVRGTTQPPVRIDTIWKGDSVIVRPVSPSPTRRDSVAKPDTLPKRDTTTQRGGGPSARRR